MYLFCRFFKKKNGNSLTCVNIYFSNLYYIYSRKVEINEILDKCNVCVRVDVCVLKKKISLRMCYGFLIFFYDRMIYKNENSENLILRSIRSCKKHSHMNTFVE